MENVCNSLLSNTIHSIVSDPIVSGPIVSYFLTTYTLLQVASATVDPQFVSLVNDVFKIPFPHYLWRGYTVVPAPDGNTILETKVGNI